MTEIAKRTRGAAKKPEIDGQELLQQLFDARKELDTANAQLQTEKDMAKSLQSDHKTLRIELEKEQEKTAALQGRIGVLEANEAHYKNMEINHRILQAVHKIVDDDRVAFIGMVGNALGSSVQEVQQQPKQPTQIHPPAPQQITGEFGE